MPDIYTRMLEQHEADKAALTEALKMVATSRTRAANDGRERVAPVVGADTLRPGQSIYRIMDAGGLVTYGFVTKTRVMWRFESIDGPVSRSRYVDQIAMAASPTKARA